MALYLFRNYIYSFNAVIIKEVNFMIEVIKVAVAVIILIIICKYAQERKEKIYE